MRAPPPFARVAVVVLAVGGCGTTSGPPPGWSLRSAATAHLRALGRIGERNRNTRAAGTPGYDASVDYVADRLRAAGYGVALQDVPFPVFRDRTPPRPRRPAGRRMPVLTLRYSGPGRATRAGRARRPRLPPRRAAPRARADRGRRPRALPVPDQGAQRGGGRRERARGRRPAQRAAVGRLADPARPAGSPPSRPAPAR